MRKQRGFTLVEMMVVIAIIAILGAMIIGLSGRTYGVNATTFSEQLSQTLQYARNRALQTRRIHRVEIHFELDPVEIYLYQATATGMKRTNITAPAPLFVERTIVPKSVSLYRAETGAKSAGVYTTPSGGGTVPAKTTTQFDIDFLPNGTADAVAGVGPSDASTIYVTEPGEARAVRVLVYAVTGSSYVRQSW